MKPKKQTNPQITTHNPAANIQIRAVRRLLPLIVIIAALWHGSILLAQDAKVHAIIFYSPSCVHCQQVMSEDLPPLLEKYGPQLEIIAISASHPDGQVLYQAAIERFNVPPERRGVPTLIIGETVLVGSLEIPQQLPGLVDGYLDQGGVSWPDVPGLAAALTSAESELEVSEAEPTSVPGPPTPFSAQSSVAQTPASEAPASTVDLRNDLEETNTFMSRFRQDVTGNTLSLFVLVGMVAAVIIVPVRLRQPARSASRVQAVSRIASWAMPLLLLIGIGVSIYMAYVETTLSPAVCGPVGDCNAVQQSPYARLFGLVPIGIIGIAGYAAMAFAWFIQHNRQDEMARQVRHLLFAMAFLGALFSIYLTFLEPFVIGATCLWCLTSAITMTLIFLFSGLLLQSPPGATGDESERYSQGPTFIIEGTNENRSNH